MPTTTSLDTRSTLDAPPEPIHHVIVDGPTEDRIWDALERDADPRLGRLPLKFVIGSGVNLLCLNITGAQHEEGSGAPLSIQGSMIDGSLFTGHYNAHTRSGYIDVITS